MTLCNHATDLKDPVANAIPSTAARRERKRPIESFSFASHSVFTEGCVVTGLVDVDADNDAAFSDAKVAFSEAFGLEKSFGMTILC